MSHATLCRQRYIPNQLAASPDPMCIPDPAKPGFEVTGLSLPKSVSQAAVESRSAFLKAVGRRYRELNDTVEHTNMDAFTAQAWKMMTLMEVSPGSTHSGEHADRPLLSCSRTLARGWSPRTPLGGELRTNQTATAKLPQPLHAASQPPIWLAALHPPLCGFFIIRRILEAFCPAPLRTVSAALY